MAPAETDVDVLTSRCYVYCARTSRMAVFAGEGSIPHRSVSSGIRTNDPSEEFPNQPNPADGLAFVRPMLIRGDFKETSIQGVREEFITRGK